MFPLAFAGQLLKNDMKSSNEGLSKRNRIPVGLLLHEEYKNLIHHGTQGNK